MYGLLATSVSAVTTLVSLKSVYSERIPAAGAPTGEKEPRRGVRLPTQASSLHAPSVGLSRDWSNAGNHRAIWPKADDSRRLIKDFPST